MSFLTDVSPFSINRQTATMADATFSWHVNYSYNANLLVLRYHRETNATFQVIFAVQDWAFRAVMDSYVVAVALSYLSILCAFYYVIVCVISSSKAGQHYQTSANLSVPMKWNCMKSCKQLLVLLVLQVPYYSNTPLEDFTAFKSKISSSTHASNIANVKCTEQSLSFSLLISFSLSLLLSCNQAVIAPLLWFVFPQFSPAEP